MAEATGDINNREPRMATAEEKNAALQSERFSLANRYDSLVETYQSLHPHQPGEQPSLISLTELVGRRTFMGRELTQAETQEFADGERLSLADQFYSSQLPLRQAQTYLNTFSEEDRNVIKTYLLDFIRNEMQRHQSRIVETENHEVIQFASDPQWLEEWRAEYPQLNDQQQAFAPDAASGRKGFFKRGLDKLGHTAGRGAELTRSGGEALINRMGQVLEDRRAFGKSVANFALHGAATRGLSMGSRELAKGIVSYSGLAGAVGGGFTGTIVAGAFVGAVSGALVEYARQVNKNLDTKAEADPSLAGRRTAFLLKFKELRHGGVLKPTDTKKILMRGLAGAVAGAGAQALIHHTEIGQLIEQSGVWERVKEMTGGAWGAVSHTAGDLKDLAGHDLEHFPGMEGVKGVAGGAKDMAGNLPGVQRIGDIAGGVGHWVGDTAGSAKDAAGNIPGVKGVGDLAGGAKDMAGNIPGVRGIGDAAGGAWHGAGEIADNAKHAVGLGGAHEAGQQAVQAPPEGFVPKADFNALQEHVTNQAQKIDDLQRQVDELKHATGVSGVVPGAGTAAAAGQAVTEQAVSNAQAALDHLGNSIPLPAGSNPWEMSTTILKQMGVNPTPEQIMQLDKVLSQENGISVPEWGIKGTIDAHNLPVGFKLNLTDTVKKAALGIASKK